jgi:hypothetical protein
VTSKWVDSDGSNARRSACGVVLAFSFALAACSGGDAPLDAGAQFVAADSDFASFTSWLSIKLPDSDPVSDLVYPAGSRVAFLNRRPPPGATRYPVGTVIVKAIERATPEDWEIFARVKRGGGFNAAGAVDWEFFLLRLRADGTPYITSRGMAPSDDGRGDMGLPSAAGGYFTGGAIQPCNLCHGESKFAANDYIMSPLLLPSATAH